MTDGLKLAACGFALMACLAGCGRSGGLTEISGTVSYDGQPVEEGNHHFPAGRRQRPHGGRGHRGRQVFREGRPGERSWLKSRATKSLASTALAAIIREWSIDQEQILPPRYNTKSELTREITSAAARATLPWKSLRARTAVAHYGAAHSDCHVRL